jgi:hypothetical protein
MLLHVLADMRSDIQDIFKMTPHDKQVMMFSATLSQDMRSVCKKFMSNVRAVMVTLVTSDRWSWGDARSMTHPCNPCCSHQQTWQRVCPTCDPSPGHPIWLSPACAAALVPVCS